MNLTLAEYFNHAIQNPIILIISALVIGLMYFNGSSGASNTVAVCVGTRSLTPKKTIALAIVFNFLGVFIMTIISSKVAQTMFTLANFGSNSNIALTALTGGLIAIVAWMGLSTLLGIPSSSSHILAASISGAAIAVNGFGALNIDSWKLVLIGLLISTVVGFFAGNIVAKIVERICRYMDRTKTTPFFKVTQIFSAGATAFMDGAQDGQKAMGIFMLAIAFAAGGTNTGEVIIPWWLMLICSLSMSLGTALNANKMIKNVGVKMVKLEPYQGTCADIANVACSVFASLTGMPMSTTHTKISSMMGVGASRNIKRINWITVRSMIVSWIITFPGCIMLAYVVTTILLKIYT